ncbi:MAG: ABC transporter substrate-binding protein [Eubacteriales bacterium]|nr:ABC transporter substrate-binding protein [Eubacteriales bacterium]
MKKLFAVILTVAMVAALFAGCGAKEAPATEAPTAAPAAAMTVTPGKLTMATSADFPPYEFTNDDGSFAGIDIDIAQAVAEKLGMELEVLDLGFDAALLAVQNGKSDIVLAGVSVTEDRQLVMDFSDSYATGIQKVIIKEGSDVTMDNLGEKMIGCQKATTGYIYASDTPENGGYGEDHVIAYEDGATAVQALLNGQIDCVIIDGAPAEAFVDANPGLAMLDGTWVEESYAIGIAKGNAALVEAVNAALAQLKADGTLDAIVAKYISAE